MRPARPAALQFVGRRFKVSDSFPQCLTRSELEPFRGRDADLCGLTRGEAVALYTGGFLPPKIVSADFFSDGPEAPLSRFAELTDLVKDRIAGG